MGKPQALCLLLFLACCPLPAQPPAIFQEGVRNAASLIPPSLPGGVLAPGTRFTIEGIRFGNTPGPVHVRVAGIEARVLALADHRIEALLPAAVPPGETSLTVSRGTETSRPFPIRIARAALGLYSANGKGWGPGRFPRLDTPSAHPGQTVLLEGTGLDGMQPLLRIAGGTPARVVSVHPKTGQPGIDQIAFVVPEGTPEGCWVPLAAVVDGHTSNTVTIAVSRTGRPCRAPAGWPRPLAAGQKTAGLLLLARAFLHAEFTPGVPADAISDESSGAFLEATPGEDLMLPVHLIPPPGACVTYTGLYESGAGFSSSLLGMLLENVRGRGLDAGPALNIQGTRGSRTVPANRRAPGFYGAVLGGETPAPGPRSRPLFLDPGDYRIAAAGGQDIGPFSLSLRMPKPFTWTNQDAIETVDRTQGITVEWQGIAPSEPAGILAVNVDQQTTAIATCFCVAPPGSRKFRIPAAMLANLPATRPGGSLPFSMLFVGARAAAQAIPARGLDAGIAQLLVLRGRGVKFR